MWNSRPWLGTYQRRLVYISLVCTLLLAIIPNPFLRTALTGASESGTACRAPPLECCSLPAQACPPAGFVPGTSAQKGLDSLDRQHGKAGPGQREWDGEGGLEIEPLLRICVCGAARTHGYMIPPLSQVLFPTPEHGEAGDQITHRGSEF